MQRQLTEAASACRPVTFINTRDQFDYIQHLALRVATQLKRLVRVEVLGQDVVVTYTAAGRPPAA